MNKNVLLILGILVLVLLLFVGMNTGYASVIKKFLPSVEGFSPVPIWDVRQWSWGYGTAAGYYRNKKPTGTISRSQAMNELVKVVDNHYEVLSNKITAKLNSKQWAAILSFAYNIGNANMLVPYINSGDTNGLFSKMKAYNNGGDLTKRRNKEIELFQS